MTGSTPLSPARIRAAYARTYSPSVCATSSGGTSAWIASGAAVRSGACSGGTSARSALLGTSATAAAQPSCGHVFDDALPVERRRLVLHHDAAQVHHRNAICHLEDVVEVVGDDHHREATVAQPLDEVEHHLRLHDSEGRSRSVHDHQLGVPHDRLGHSH